MLLKSSVAQIFAPIGSSCGGFSFKVLGPLIRPVKVLFAPKVRSHQAEVGARPEEQWSKDRRAHDDVRYRKAPSAGLARHAAHVEKESGNSIREGDNADPAQDSARAPAAEHSEEACSCKRGAQSDRRVHHRIAIAAFVVFIANFEAARYAGCRDDETQAALKTAFAQVLKRGDCGAGNGLRKTALRAALQCCRQIEGCRPSFSRVGSQGPHIVRFLRG